MYRRGKSKRGENIVSNRETYLLISGSKSTEYNGIKRHTAYLAVQLYFHTNEMNGTNDGVESIYYLHAMEIAQRKLSVKISLKQ